MSLPAIPKNPLTIGVNEVITDMYFKNFINKYLPAFEVIVTSKYRDPQKNKQVGGALLSSHQYGLARDFVLMQDSQTLSIDRARNIYNEFIKPNWPNFSMFEEHEGKYHIHLNLNRDISTYTGLAVGAGLLGIGLYYLRKKRII